jgi:hypothetical protein
MDIRLYGLGAIGSNLLVQLAKQFPDANFYGIDFDKIEERNIRTQAYFLEHVGLYKADAMRVILGRYLRKPKYTAVKTKVEGSVYMGVHGPEGLDAHLGIDCFDNTKSRKLFQNSGHVFHVGFSPEYSAEGIWHNKDYEVANDVDPTKNDICSMTDAVPFIHFVVNLAALNIARWIQTKEKRDFLVTGKHKVKWL